MPMSIDNDQITALISCGLPRQGYPMYRKRTSSKSGFCQRAINAGIPIGRAHVFIDTRCIRSAGATCFARA